MFFLKLLDIFLKQINIKYTIPYTISVDKYTMNKKIKIKGYMQASGF